MKKLKVGIIGGTGMVGQYFISLLQNHPWFEVALIAASEHSSGKTYREAIAGRWLLNRWLPNEAALKIMHMRVENALNVKSISEKVDFIFSAISLDKQKTAQLEEEYARCETPVVSNNSAHRWTSDVPMIIPEINPEHIRVIEDQCRRLKTKRGFIVTKPNCSLQSYVPAIHALRKFNPFQIVVSTYQAVSGAGKTLESWPEMQDNVLPFIAREEEKSEREPLKIWGKMRGGKIQEAKGIIITAQCVRVPVSYGHLATVFMSLAQKATRRQIIEGWRYFKTIPQKLSLPSAPSPFITYFDENDRPQTKLDRNLQGGMGVALGRLRKDPIFNYKFVALSHNTIRGAAGGAILLAELLKAQGYINRK
jgi:aspartate-semialdehyde dehydrogenase